MHEQFSNPRHEKFCNVILFPDGKCDCGARPYGWTSKDDRPDDQMSLDDLLRLIDNGEIARKAFYSFELDLLYDNGYAVLVRGTHVKLSFKGLQELPNAQRRHYVDKRAK